MSGKTDSYRAHVHKKVGTGHEMDKQANVMQDNCSKLDHVHSDQRAIEGKRKRKPNPKFNNFELGIVKKERRLLTRSKHKTLTSNENRFKEESVTEMPATIHNKIMTIEEPKSSQLKNESHHENCIEETEKGILASNVEIIEHEEPTIQEDGSHLATIKLANTVQKRRRKTKSNKHNSDSGSDVTKVTNKLIDVTEGFRTITVPAGVDPKTLETGDDIRISHSDEFEITCNRDSIITMNAANSDSDHGYKETSGEDGENHKAEDKKQRVVFECEICRKLLMTKGSLKYHHLSCMGQKKHVYSVSGNSYVNETSLQRHVQTHTNAKESKSDDKEMFERVDESTDTVHDMMKCLVCSVIVERKKMASHRKSHVHKESYVCDRCGKSFTTCYSLKVHMRLHEPDSDKLFRCSHCSATFLKYIYLEAHEKLHSGERPFICEICSAAFSTKMYITQHVKTVHNAEKCFKCDICNESFSLKKILKFHRDTHMAKTFKCDYCPLLFKNVYDQRKHEKQHTGIKNFHCPICGHGFLSNGPYFKHMWRKHRMEKKEAKVIKDNINREKKLTRMKEKCKKITGDEANDMNDVRDKGDIHVKVDTQHIEITKSGGFEEEIENSQESSIQNQEEIGKEIDHLQGNVEAVDIMEEIATEHMHEHNMQEIEISHENIREIEISNEDGQESEISQQNIQEIEISHGQEIEISHENGQEIGDLNENMQEIEILNENGEIGDMRENMQQVEIVQDTVHGIGNSEKSNQEIQIMGHTNEIVIYVSTETSETESVYSFQNEVL